MKSVEILSDLLSTVNEDIDEAKKDGYENGYEDGYAVGFAEGVKFEPVKSAFEGLETIKNPRYPDNPMTREELAEMLGAEIKKSITRASNTKHRWSDELVEKFENMIRNGFTVDEIYLTNNIGFTKSAIVTKAWKLGYLVNDGIFYKKPE